MSRLALNSLTEKNVRLISKIEKASAVHRTFGERVADAVTAWVGSWTFLIVQSTLLVAWMIVNVVGWWQKWDPYPFILLNLVLSFQAAYATPIIMMSQNRQARLSDRRNQLDLQINLLAEQENTEQLRLLRLLCEKHGVKLGDEEEEALEEMTHPDEILEQLDQNAAPAVGRRPSQQTTQQSS